MLNEYFKKRKELLNKIHDDIKSRKDNLDKKLQDENIHLYIISDIEEDKVLYPEDKEE